MRHLPSLLLVLLLASAARAQLYEVSWPDGSGGAFCGSGAAIGAHYLVTNSHVIGQQAGHHVSVSSQGGSSPGLVVACDAAKDLAIVKTDAQLEHPARLGTTPRAGQPVRLLGVKSGCVPTQVISSAVYLDRDCTIPVIQLAAPSQQGDSGGGIYDAAGNLVAINWGSSQGHAHAVSVDLLNAWLPDIEQHCGPLGCVACQPQPSLGSAPAAARQVFVQLPPQPLGAPVTQQPVAELQPSQQQLQANGFIITISIQPTR